MNRLMKFTEAEAKPAEPTNTLSEDSAGSKAIEQLRHRLIADPYRDCVEVKASVVGELVYECYKQLAKRRYL